MNHEKASPPLFCYSPSMPYIESRAATNSSQCYERHTHPTISIGVIDDGQGTYQNHNVKQTINKGSLVLINPEVVHSCNPEVSGNWSYKRLNIDR